MGDFFVYILKSSVCLAAFYLFYIDLHNVATRLSSKLIDSFGFAGAWSSVKQTAEALPQTCVFKVFLNFSKSFRHEKRCKLTDLRQFLTIVDESLGCQALTFCEVVIAMSGCVEIKFAKKVFFGILCQFEMVGVDYAVIVEVLDEFVLQFSGL